MIDCLPLVALAGSPSQWLAVISMAILIFAPRWLPGIARFVGHTMKLSLGAKTTRVDGVKVRQPANRDATLRQGSGQPLGEPRRTGVPTQRPPWVGLVVAAILLAVLLWAVLHAR